MLFDKHETLHMLELAHLAAPEDGPLRELLELLIHNCGLLEQKFEQKQRVVCLNEY